MTDNAACKKEYVVDEEGERWEERGGPYCKDHCVSFTPDDPLDIEPNPPGKIMATCVTENGILLGGKTGASRPNMFLIPDSSVGGGVRVVLAYEESKGLGWGGDKGNEHRRELNDPTDPPKGEDEGKNIFYHTFDYKVPQVISHGTMLNLPQMATNGKPLMSEDGSVFLTNNARRVRFIVQVSPLSW